MRWERTTDGFAVNLDGSSAARGLSFPRLELHTSPTGWEGRCLLGDGTSVALPRGGYPSLAAARAALVARAREALGPVHAPALDALTADAP